MRLFQFHLSTGLLILGAIAAIVSSDVAELPAQSGFDGVVTFQQYDQQGKPEGTMVQTTKGSKLRISSSGRGDHDKDNAMIFDGDSKSMMVVIADEKKAIRFTQQDAALMREKMSGLAQGMPASKTADDYHLQFAPAGRTETIAGVPCDVWHGSSESKGKKEEGEVCIANGVGFAMFDAMANSPMLMGNPKSGGAGELAKFRSLVGKGKGILKMVRFDNGKPITELEATNIQRGSVSDASFVVPPGYQVVTMSEMMQQMGAGARQKHTP